MKETSFIFANIFCVQKLDSRISFLFMINQRLGEQNTKKVIWSVSPDSTLLGVTDAKIKSVFPQSGLYYQQFGFLRQLFRLVDRILGFFKTTFLPLENWGKTKWGCGLVWCAMLQRNSTFLLILLMFSFPLEIFLLFLA